MKTGTIAIIRRKGVSPSIKAELVNNDLWICKYDIAALFNCFPAKIEMNLRSIFKNHLLWEAEVSRTYRYIDKGIEKRIVYYNLEVLTFLSCRIDTVEAGIFRQFVQSALRERLQKRDMQESVTILWYCESSFAHRLN